MKNLFLITLFSVLLLSCARVGSPVGGTKDSIAPNFVTSNIDSPRVNVPTDLKELRIHFDEYITLKEVSRNLIISPPIKYKRILPSGLGNKYIQIEWDEPLQENTTYNFNFGNSIVDLNEGNVLPYFNFAFSTGPELDQLYISGDVFDGMKAQEENPTMDSKNNYVIGLYKESDSIDYRQKPYYVTKADADGYFELNYLSPGTYRIIAFNDENMNTVYDAGKEAVGFRKDPIVLEQSISGIPIYIYPSKKPFKYLEGKEVAGGILMTFEGQPKSVEIKSLTEKLKDYKVTHKANSDSVNVWFDANKQDIGISQNDRLQLSYNADGNQDTVFVSYRKTIKDEMTLASAFSTVPPKKDFEIISNYPLENINTQSWTLNSDSISRPFTAKISEANPNKILVSSNFEIGKKYELTVPSKTVNSFYKTTDKAYQFNFEIDKAENYGKLTLNLENKPDAKFWIQFLNEGNEVLFSKFTDEAQHQFNELKPATYKLRILVDNNGNGIWDEADFLNHTFAEDVYLFPKKIEIRPLWENVETWNLGTNTTGTPVNKGLENVPPLKEEAEN